MFSGKKNVNIDDAVLGTFMSLPGVGKKKALELLKKYPSKNDFCVIRQISNCCIIYVSILIFFDTFSDLWFNFVQIV